MAGKPLSLRTLLGWATLAAAALAIAFLPPPLAATSPVQRQVHITASTFEFAPAVIAVNPGDEVSIVLTSADVVHGLFVDDYELSVTAESGQPARLTFVADQPGVFRLRCSVTCGPLHPFMAGKLQVGPNWQFWRVAGLAILAALGGAWLVGGGRLAPSGAGG